MKKLAQPSLSAILLLSLSAPSQAYTFSGNKNDINSCARYESMGSSLGGATMIARLHNDCNFNVKFKMRPVNSNGACGDFVEYTIPGGGNFYDVTAYTVCKNYTYTQRV